jgi:hypothetical protein
MFVVRARYAAAHIYEEHPSFFFFLYTEDQEQVLNSTLLSSAQLDLVQTQTPNFNHSNHKHKHYKSQPRKTNVLPSEDTTMFLQRLALATAFATAALASPIQSLPSASTSLLDSATNMSIEITELIEMPNMGGKSRADVNAMIDAGIAAIPTTTTTVTDNDPSKQPYNWLSSIGHPYPRDMNALREQHERLLTAVLPPLSQLNTTIRAKMMLQRMLYNLGTPKFENLDDVNNDGDVGNDDELFNILTLLLMVFPDEPNYNLPLAIKGIVVITDQLLWGRLVEDWRRTRCRDIFYWSAKNLFEKEEYEEKVLELAGVFLVLGKMLTYVDEAIQFEDVEDWY